jgi:hypothetical protein
VLYSGAVEDAGEGAGDQEVSMPHEEFLRDCPEWQDEVKIQSAKDVVFTPESWKAFLNWSADNNRLPDKEKTASALRWAGDQS